MRKGLSRTYPKQDLPAVQGLHHVPQVLLTGSLANLQLTEVPCVGGKGVLVVKQGMEVRRMGTEVRSSHMGTYCTCTELLWSRNLLKPSTQDALTMPAGPPTKETCWVLKLSRRGLSKLVKNVADIAKQVDLSSQSPGWQ